MLARLEERTFSLPVLEKTVALLTECTTASPAAEEAKAWQSATPGF
ncbi:MAG: hypothetical protein IPP10_18840 [Candidatus Competibacteraceae bacterium]|nr:hypothetical protein [Candidatus Competibacteraceae bacterium]